MFPQELFFPVNTGPSGRGLRESIFTIVKTTLHRGRLLQGAKMSGSTGLAISELPLRRGRYSFGVIGLPFRPQFERGTDAR